MARPRTFKARRRSLARPAAAAAVAAALAVPSGAAFAQPAQARQGVDWKAVGTAIGKELKPEEGGVHTAEWLRTDLRVVNAGVAENPGMELGAEAAFHDKAAGGAVMIGEATLKADEVGPVADRLQRGGVEVTALHKHLQDETPRLWWLHYAGYGDPVAMARTVRAALSRTGIPLGQKEGKEPPVALDVAALNRVIGAKGEDENGVLQYHVPVAAKIVDTRAGIRLPAPMEASTLLMFQPLGGGRAAVNGDFTMTAEHVNPVIRALRERGLTVVELHNHLLYEQPRLFYLHFWKTGDAGALARDLRAALDQAGAARS
uniref:LppY/LpqO family protein n=1 Tax=Nonomuraea pusilla TaxID=46177 RepID=UPI0006E16379|nr:LppY/LpqO family protein [Nonomuraea pusilla]